MATTYSGDPSSSDLDQVRFLVGDTDVTAAKLQDAEIEFLVLEWQNTYLAAAAAADYLSSNAAAWISYQADDNTLSLSDAQEKYARMADALRAQYSRRYRAPWYVGGMDRGDFEAYVLDDSVRKGKFSEGIHDNRYISGQSGGATQEDLRGEL